MLTITVDTFVDERDLSITDGDVSLRDAIEQAPAGETIDFAPTLDGTTITLLSTLGLGQIDIIGKTLTIDASSLPSGVTIDADDPSPNQYDGIRIFNITDPTAGASPPLVTLIGLTLTGADPDDDSHNAQGGAIRSAGFLTLRDMVVDGNAAESGAGVYLDVEGQASIVRDVLRIENSRVEHNSAYGNGGGVFVRFDSRFGGKDRVQIDDSVLSHNVAGPLGPIGSGGALYVQSGNGSSAAHSVVISSTRFELNEADQGGAISYPLSGSRVDLSILQGSTISGNTATSFRGGGLYAHVSIGSIIRVEESTINDNTSAQTGGGISVRLAESASFSIADCEISGNTASNGDGGGVYAESHVDIDNPLPTPRAITISRSLISENTASNRGGGVYAFTHSGTETLIEESRITGNQVPANPTGGDRNGGGVYAYVWDDFAGTRPEMVPRFTISGSTIDNNHADQKGGGVFVCGKYFGTFITVNSTISSNSTLDQANGGGGGMFIARYGSAYSQNESIDAYLRNVTVTQNTSADGGGVHALDLDNVRVRIANSIVSENFNHQSAADNLVGRLDITNTQFNLVGSGSAVLNLAGQPATLDATNITNEDDPKLSVLADHGGPTPTHALLLGSRAIDAGLNALASHPLTGDIFTTDQRGMGFARRLDVAV
jgi:hypothetical protein